MYLGKCRKKCNFTGNENINRKLFYPNIMGDGMGCSSFLFRYTY